MPIVRVNDKGGVMKKWHRRVAMLSTGVVLAGLTKFLLGDPGWGLMIMILGNSISSIWNLADD
jgi:TM2 domain-containing membrane protein YozV